MKVQIYTSWSKMHNAHVYRWRVFDDDETIICKSTRGYIDETECAQELFRVYNCLENAHMHPGYTPRKQEIPRWCSPPYKNPPRTGERE